MFDRIGVTSPGGKRGLGELVARSALMGNGENSPNQAQADHQEYPYRSLKSDGARVHHRSLRIFDLRAWMLPTSETFKKGGCSFFQGSLIASDARPRQHSGVLIS